MPFKITFSLHPKYGLMINGKPATKEGEEVQKKEEKKA